MDGIDPPKPVCHAQSETTNGMIKMCGRGSHTVPTCSGPGVFESNTRRAMLICATASPSSRTSPRWKCQWKARTDRHAAMNTTTRVEVNLTTEEQKITTKDTKDHEVKTMAVLFLSSNVFLLSCVPLCSFVSFVIDLVVVDLVFDLLAVFFVSCVVRNAI